ncbi:FAD-dependent oxidoreductase [Neorhodopirellula pilleata]
MKKTTCVRTKRFPLSRFIGILSSVALLAFVPGVSVAQNADIAQSVNSYDIVVYGGTSGGIAAAVQAKRMGRSVVVIEPSQRLGGLTTGGLGQTDIGNKAAVGGIAREFYQAVRAHYEKPEAWKWQAKEEYRSRGQSMTSKGEDTMWTFEPSTASKIYQNWIAEYEIPVIYGERLDRNAGVAMTRSLPWRIIAIRMESGRTFSGKMFIDATYEGDLMASAKVDYTFGREPNSRYDETLSGVQTSRAVHHQLVDGVDAYLTPGQPESGLLPFIDASAPLADGSGDDRIQAYCFRMCMTDHPDNRIPFHKPDGYEPMSYELLLRNFEAGERRVPLSIGIMPNRKTDTNNNFGVSTDFIGQNYEYPEATYERRAEIVAEHLKYQQGLMWTLANHPRVPENVRNEVSRWGMCKDEFTEGNGWQQQLYIREARRMISDYVMTQHHCQGRQIADVPVGMAAYTMDSHHVRRYVTEEGKVRNEGDVQVGGFVPYPIDYKSIVPKANQCGNLLVPVCLSASHMAFGSIRMEPVFMVLGQSAATAAGHAIDQRTMVQRIDTAKLVERLLADHQVLEWTGPRPGPRAAEIQARSLPGIVVDDEQARRVGFESVGTTVGPYIGVHYRHDSDTEKGNQSIRLTTRFEKPGRYEVRIAYGSHANRATNVPVKIAHADGEASVKVNQRKPPSIDRLFEPLGVYSFLANTDYTVEIGNAGTDGFVIVDAIQWIAAEPLE